MSPVPNFAYTSGNPDNLVGGTPAVMTDVQGPFYDLRAYLNANIVTVLNSLSPPSQVLTGAPVLDVGLLNQIRAGRQLTAADFTALGLSAPLGLWNLSDLTDASGNARNLINKGAVPFGSGINGLPATAAVFSGSTGQALYISDTGAADPFRIRTGSWGCWFRTAKRGISQDLLTKLGAAGAYGWWIEIAPLNMLSVGYSPDGTNPMGPTGISDVCDDRWHFGVGTYDGTVGRVYVDGVLEATQAATGPIFGSAAPLNVGARSADGATAAGLPHYGRIDEAFVTADVLSDDQVRLLYAAKIVHGLTVAPRTASVNVNRRRKGAALAVADFSVSPIRLHNFTAGGLNDEGSGGVALINNGGAVSVAGADGALGDAFSFAGAQSLSSTDAGLPAGTAARSYGCWFKTTSAGGVYVFLAYGTLPNNALALYMNSGTLVSASGTDNINGPYATDGQWHFVVAVDDNAAGDGLRRKLYLDGRLVGASMVLGSLTLAGANRFRVGAHADGTQPFTGQIDGAFVTGYAMTMEEIGRQYAKGSQALGASPKNAGDHIERMDSTAVYFIGDTLNSTAQVDLGVAV